jgi:hypothetical protein
MWPSSHSGRPPCAVPPTLPADPEGVGAYPAAGPYYVAEYRPGERVVIRQNRFYGGTRSHHVDGFTVDLQAASHEEVLDRIERGEADWGWALTPAYLDPARQLAAKYGINRSQFFLKPGLAFRGYAFNASRPLFRNNPRLRQAVNFAIDRSALRRAGGGENESVLTDQYLPSTMPGFKDARIYPLEAPDLRRARDLARGHIRGGKALRYTVESPQQPGHGCVISASCPSTAARTASRALPKATKNESPCVSISRPPCAATAARSRRWCSASTSGYPSRSCLRSRVEPSMSVNRKVTAPLGRSDMPGERDTSRAHEASPPS